MRSTKAFFLLLAVTTSTTTMASGASLDRVKSGILPTGGYYHLYEARCADQQLVTVASTDRSTRWCAERGGDVSCFRRSQDAVVAACSSQVAGVTQSNLGAAD